MSESTHIHLADNSYGKSDVRLTKVIRRGDRHELLEFSVDITLHGDFTTSYTAGDNSNVVATDSMKNTVYVLAKENDFATPEQFAVLLSRHFCHTYRQVKRATVVVRQTAWDRITVDGRPHDHAFIGSGSHKLTAVADATKEATTISGGVIDLLVLKTTRSAFKGFVTDRYRTLPDTDDRILATKITASWVITDSSADYAAVRQRVMTAVLEQFAMTMSYAVQQTMYEMGRAALAAAPEIVRVDLELPNKHRIPVNLKPFGLENKNEVFVWTDEPFGNISASIARNG